MDYVNFCVSLPALTYLKLENSAKEIKISKEELSAHVIKHYLTRRSKVFKGKKSAGFHGTYN